MPPLWLGLGEGGRRRRQGIAVGSGARRGSLLLRWEDHWEMSIPTKGGSGGGPKSSIISLFECVFVSGGCGPGSLLEGLVKPSDKDFKEKKRARKRVRWNPDKGEPIHVLSNIKGGGELRRGGVQDRGRPAKNPRQIERELTGACKSRTRSVPIEVLEYERGGDARGENSRCKGEAYRLSFLGWTYAQRRTERPEGQKTAGGRIQFFTEQGIRVNRPT